MEKGLSLMVCQKPIMTEKWLELLDARREMVGNFIKEVTLPTVGDLTCDGLGGYFLRECNPDTPLTIQGLFSGGLPQERKGDEMDIFFWGLDKKGEFLLIIVACTWNVEASLAGVPRWQPKEIIVQGVSSANLTARLGCSAKEIYLTVSLFVNKLINKLDDQYRSMKNLENCIKWENTTLSLIPI